MIEENINIKEAEISEYLWLKEHDDDIDHEIIKTKIDRKEVLVVQENNKIIGWLRFNYFWDDIPFITHLWLINGYRQKGIGTKFINYWEKKMKKKGHNIVLTSTQKTNENAQFFYKKRGYFEIGGFNYLDEPYEIIYMKKI